ncbi:unnamed protein product [Merluccius merluccius]
MEEQQHVFSDLREVQSFIEQNEAATMTKFVVYGTHAAFFDNQWQPTSNTRVFWEWSRGEGTPTISFTGTPFMFIGTKEMGCHLGRDISESKKRKERPILLSIVDNRDRTRRAASGRLKQALRRDPVVWQNVYVVRTPAAGAHAGHAVGGPVVWSRKTFVRKECVDLLKRLADQVHLVEEQRGLEHIKTRLVDLLEDVQPMVPNENPAGLQNHQVHLHNGTCQTESTNPA